MDKIKEQEFQTQIDTLKSEKDALDAQVKEFTEKERLATEAKAKADEEARVAASKAEQDAKVEAVKVFCETAIKENRMTPAMREKDEPIMVSLPADVLKSFQEKYTNPIVPLGETNELNEQVKAEKTGRLDKAAAYVKANPKEFAGLDSQQAIARAVYLEATARIKF